MYYYFGIGFFVSVVLFLLIAGIKNKNILWIFLFCLGIFPLIGLLTNAVYSIFYGSGLEGDKGGIFSGLLVIVFYISLQWYIYVPSIALTTISFNRAFLKEKK